MGRRPTPIRHPRLFDHLVDFGALSTLADVGAVDDVFITLGTTIKTAGSEAAFRAVDLVAVVSVARTAKQLGAERLGVVSAMGANARSRVFYNRVKGEMEQALATLGYKRLVIARPSMLIGDRAALAQHNRPAEKLGLAAMSLLKPLIPPNYRAISAAQVARALVAGVNAGGGVQVLLSGDLQHTP